LTLDVKKSNSSNETPNVMTVGVEKYYGLRGVLFCFIGRINIRHVAGDSTSSQVQVTAVARQMPDTTL
jgi:hypothetical protein